MNVSLSPHFDAFIGKMVATGKYNSASEVIRDALRVLENQKKEEELKLENLRAAIDEGINSGPAIEWNLKNFLQEARDKYGIPNED